MTVACICGCHRPAQDWHHVVTQAELRKHGGDPGDRANMVPISRTCHERHHNASRRLTLHCLPEECFSYARNLMGAGLAYEWLRRRYVGDDWRLDDLLAEWRASLPTVGKTSRLVGGEAAA